MKEFCSQYRLPYENFKELLQELGNHADFDKWTPGRTNNAKKHSSPLSLLLLGVLQYLGKGGCWDDCQHGTNINKETHRHFFHLFLKYGSTVLFRRLVVFPTTAEKAKPHIHEMEMRDG